MENKRYCLICGKELIITGKKRDQNKKYCSIQCVNKGKIGTHFSDESKKRVSEAGKGRTAWNAGKTKQTDERLMKMSIKIKYLMENTDLKERISIGTKKAMTPEVNKKISEKAKKRIVKDETRKKMSKMYSDGKAPFCNKHHTEKNKRILSKKQRLNTIARMEKNGNQYTPSYNKRSIEFFKQFNEDFQMNGVFAENPREHLIKELGYFVDYYDPKANLILEWNEKHHYDKNRFTEKHKIRQNKIKKHLKCKIINIKQETFNQEKAYSKIRNRMIEYLNSYPAFFDRTVEFKIA